MPATIWSRIFCLLVIYPKVKRLKYKELQFGCCSIWVYNLVSDMMEVLPTTEQNADLP